MNCGATMTAQSREQNLLSVRRAKRGIYFFLCVCVALDYGTAAQAKRPKIAGVAGVTVYVSDITAARHYYSGLGLSPLNDPKCNQAKEACYGVGRSQRIDVLEGHDSLTGSSVGDSFLGEITFLTDDISALQ